MDDLIASIQAQQDEDERLAQENPRHNAHLWGIDITGTHIYRTSSPPWTIYRVQGEAPRERPAPWAFPRMDADEPLALDRGTLET